MTSKITWNQEQLRERFSYDHLTGQFTSRPFKEEGKRSLMHAKAVGGNHCEGYTTVGINNRQYLAHRLAWIYMYGDCPEYLDHIDGNRKNNAISNLREATKAQNGWNSKKPVTNTSGYSRTGKFRALLKMNGKTIHLGRFETAELAGFIYELACEKYRGAFGRAYA